MSGESVLFTVRSEAQTNPATKLYAGKTRRISESARGRSAMKLMRRAKTMT